MRSGEVIKEARLLAGLSQDGLAERIGVPRQSIARWEKQGEASPEGDRLIRLVYAGTKWGDRKLAPFIAQLNQIERRQGAEKMILRERHKSWERQTRAA